jgi:hypothetical protein
MWVMWVYKGRTCFRWRRWWRYDGCLFYGFVVCAREEACPGEQGHGG